MDVVAYAAQIAAQLGAHIIKVNLPTAHLEQAAAKRRAKIRTCSRRLAPSATVGDLDPSSDGIRSSGQRPRR
jgi:hypothetical protein